ncbi:interleukin-1 receptor-associated kinase 4-like [Saccostrea echinata]|uniref:interleukin-1 receptor-associated kinase 4-like n=1 Tax=Saccostrea echinata TaxID=191078 RepID=UPI002A7F6A6A|nr:interleukin-1 receptor-associated kinase 4-like [Saccostrea echinata]
MSNEVTADTYIRKLPYSAILKIVNFLEPDQLWKRFLCHVPKRLDDEIFEERYSTSQAKMIENRAAKPGTYATRIILEEWGTQNARVKHLIKALTKARLYAAADYLAVVQLKGSPVPREDEPILSPVGPCSLTPNEQKNLENRSFEKRELYNKAKMPDSAPGQPDSTTENDTRTSYSSEDFVRDDSGTLNHRTPSECSENRVLVNRIESYDSGGRTPDLNASPCSVSTDRHTSKPLSTVYRPGSQAINFSVLQFHTNSFDERPASQGGSVIGRGGFGTVYKARFQNNYVVAVKRLKDPEDPVMLKQFETELKTLAAYHHENIVELVGYSIDGPEKCLVYEFMPNGSLEDRLHCLNGTPPLSWQLRLDIAYGTARGIVYLNDNGLVHRDIKSANVLLDEKFVPKVGDFATARLAPSGSSTTVASTKLVIGTSAYMAPEAIRFDISAKLDSFAFGVVLLEILTGLPPSDNNREDTDLYSHVLENVEDSIIHLLDHSAGPWCHQTADDLYHIALRCLKDRKRERVQVKEVLHDLQKLLAGPS